MYQSRAVVLGDKKSIQESSSYNNEGYLQFPFRGRILRNNLIHNRRSQLLPSLIQPPKESPILRTRRLLMIPFLSVFGDETVGVGFDGEEGVDGFDALPRGRGFFEVVFDVLVDEDGGGGKGWGVLEEAEFVDVGFGEHLYERYEYR